MALIKCPECERKISDKAGSCPHCGCPLEVVGEPQKVKLISVKLNKMKLITKKRLIISISVVLVLGIVFLGIYAFVKNMNNQNKYDSAIFLVSEGKYQEAIEVFGNLGDFKDSEEQVTLIEEKMKPIVKSAIENVVETTPTPSPAIIPTPEPMLEERIDTDFRNAKWGDDIETIQKYETAIGYQGEQSPLASDNNGLLYEGEIAGIKTYIMYLVDSSKGLYRAIYGISEDHTNNSLYITDYDNLKKALIEKYGEPYEDEIITLNNAADMVDDGTALNFGYRAYAANWETDTTTIMLGMVGDNYKISTVIEYASKDIVPETDVSNF